VRFAHPSRIGAAHGEGAPTRRVDPHKASNTLAVLAPVRKTVLDSKRFPNTAEGYQRPVAFAGCWQ
jgi:hypothetical protein